jgi:hypothetical protein
VHYADAWRACTGLVQLQHRPFSAISGSVQYSSCLLITFAPSKRSLATKGLALSATRTVISTASMLADDIVLAWPAAAAGCMAGLPSGAHDSPMAASPDVSTDMPLVLLHYALEECCCMCSSETAVLPNRHHVTTVQATSISNN